MLKIARLVAVAVMAAAVAALAAGCANTVKKVAADALFYQVKKEKPLTQGDMDTLVGMIKSQKADGGLGATRAIYVAGKTVTDLVRQYAPLAQMAGLDPDTWTVPQILALLDQAGLVEKEKYDYLRGIDLKIFDPTEAEAQVIDQNKLPLIMAVAQLAASLR